MTKFIKLNEEQQKIEELKSYLKQEIDNWDKSWSDYDPDEINWDYQQGILISSNQAKLIFGILNEITGEEVKGWLVGEQPALIIPTVRMIYHGDRRIIDNESSDVFEVIPESVRPCFNHTPVLSAEEMVKEYFNEEYKEESRVFTFEQLAYSYDDILNLMKRYASQNKPVLSESKMVDRKAYEKLIAEDIEWLNKQGDTLESRHIKDVLTWSIDKLYTSTGVGEGE